MAERLRIWSSMPTATTGLSAISLIKNKSEAADYSQRLVLPCWDGALVVVVSLSCRDPSDVLRFRARLRMNFTDFAEKRRGLELLVRKHEPQPQTVLARLARDDEEDVRKVAIVRIAVDAINGKQGPKPKQ
jgi:hypothetical protein